MVTQTPQSTVCPARPTMATIRSAEDWEIVEELMELQRRLHHAVTWDAVWSACRVLLQSRPSDPYRLHVYRLVQGAPELEAMRIFLGTPRDLPGINWAGEPVEREVRMTMPPPELERPEPAAAAAATSTWPWHGTAVGSSSGAPPPPPPPMTQQPWSWLAPPPPPTQQPWSWPASPPPTMTQQPGSAAAVTVDITAPRPETLAPPRDADSFFALERWAPAARRFFGSGAPPPPPP